jgi:hypothetical protein
MYFECHQGIESEDGGCYPHRYLMATDDPSFSKHHWYKLLWGYGSRKFTKATDKFPALSGLARLFEQKFQSKYVAGLWSTDIINGLAWQGLGDSRPQAVLPGQYIAPSWSWASYAGVAAVSIEVKRLPIAEVIDSDVKVKTEANPYGEIESAWIRLRAPITPLLPSTVETTDHEARLQRAGLTPLPRLRTRYSDDEEGSWAKLDYKEQETTGTWRGLDLYAMVLYGHQKEENSTKQAAQKNEEEGSQETNEKESKQENKAFDLRNYFALILTRVENSGQGAGMKRLGWTFIEDPEGTKLVNDLSNWETVTLF